MLTIDVGERWTIVHHEPNDPVVRRYPVPGGWLYQVSGGANGIAEAWSPPVFVPHMNVMPESTR